MIVYRVLAALAAATLVSPTAIATARAQSPVPSPSSLATPVTAQAGRGDDRSAFTFTAAPVSGRDALAVSGRGPASTVITFTLIATIAHDLPDVTLNRISAISAPDGAFSTTIPLAPRPPSRSLLSVRATAAGVAPVTIPVPFSRPQTNDTDNDRVPRDL